MKNNLVIKFFKEFMGSVVKKQILAFIYLLIFTIANLTFPYFIKLVVDGAIEQGKINLLFFYGGGMLLNGALLLIFKYLQYTRFVEIGQAVVLNVKNKVLQKIMRLSWDFFSRHNSGEIISIIERDINALEELATNVLSNILVNLLTTVGLFVVLYSMNWKIGLMAFVSVIIFSLIQNKLGRLMKVKTSKLREMIAKVQVFTQELLTGISFIQILNCQKTMTKKYMEKQSDYVKSNIEVAGLNVYITLIGMGFNVFSIILAIWIGGFDVLGGQMTVGTLFTLTVYIQRVYGPVVSLSNSYITIQQSKAILERVFGLLEARETVIDGSYLPEHPLKGKIEFKNIDFAYNDGHEVLKKLNMDINSGEIIGLVGENGCGKTTVTRILSRLCEPQSGDVYIDGVQIKEYRLEYLRDQIGYMTQKVFIFNGTIRENLLISAQDVQKEELDRILELVGLEKDIKNMPDGLEAFVGENGSNLSIGQTQKIALARILLKKSPIVILDEPTAAFDIESEKFLSQNLICALEGRTVILISHRPELLKHCNRIVKLSEFDFFEGTKEDQQTASSAS